MPRKYTTPTQQFVRVCACGCGQPTTIPHVTGRMRRHAVGQPNDYVRGHQRRDRSPEYRVDEYGCWLWQRALDRNGYGRAHDDDGKAVFAHVLYWERANGPVPPGMVLDHVRARGCLSHACVNPAHLEPVTQAENVRRGRQTRLTVDQIPIIRALRAAGVKRADIAVRFGVHPNTISEIVKGRNWRDIA